MTVVLLPIRIAFWFVIIFFIHYALRFSDRLVKRGVLFPVTELLEKETCSQLEGFHAPYCGSVPLKMMLSGNAFLTE